MVSNHQSKTSVQLVTGILFTNGHTYRHIEVKIHQKPENIIIMGTLINIMCLIIMAEEPPEMFYKSTARAKADF